MTTSPDVRTEAGRILAAATPAEQQQTDIDLDTLAWRRQDRARGWPDDLAEIVEGPYVPGDLKMHALAVMPPEPA